MKRIAICADCLRKSTVESVWCVRCPVNGGRDAKTMLIPGDAGYEEAYRKRQVMIRKQRFPLLKLRALKVVLKANGFEDDPVKCMAKGCDMTNLSDLGLWRKAGIMPTRQYGVSSLYPSVLKKTALAENYEVYCRLHGVRFGGAPSLEEEPKADETRAPAPKTVRMLDVIQAALARQGDKQP